LFFAFAQQTLLLFAARKRCFHPFSNGKPAKRLPFEEET